ncbi:MAG: PIG-L deacetylase family protein, partial [Actinomycetales bacterium]
YCLVTYGDAGGFDPAVPRVEIPGIREAEQRAAGKVLGVDDIRFLGYPDGRVEPTYELRRDISRVIRQVRPQRILVQSPEWNFARIGASHPDHMKTGEAAWRAIYPDARNPFAHPELLQDEGLEDWKVREVWMMGGKDPDTVVDITDVFDLKVEALRAHASQTEHMGEQLVQVLRDWGGMNAREGGLPEGRLAEAFNVYDIPR